MLVEGWVPKMWFWKAFILRKLTWNIKFYDITQTYLTTDTHMRSMQIGTLSRTSLQSHGLSRTSHVTCTLRWGIRSCSCSSHSWNSRNTTAQFLTPVWWSERCGIPLHIGNGGDLGSGWGWIRWNKLNTTNGNRWFGIFNNKNNKKRIVTMLVSYLRSSINADAKD